MTRRKIRFTQSSKPNEDGVLTRGKVRSRAAARGAPVQSAVTERQPTDTDNPRIDIGAPRARRIVSGDETNHIGEARSTSARFVAPLDAPVLTGAHGADLVSSEGCNG
jgi:hypothetical protein